MGHNSFPPDKIAIKSHTAVSDLAQILGLLFDRIGSCAINGSNDITC
jgi:hypothetical protein